MTEPPTPPLPFPGLRWRGFTLQLFLLTILPLSLLLVLIAFGSQSLHHDAMRALVGDRDLRAVRAAANSLSEQVQQRAAVIQLLAAQPVTSPLPQNTAQVFDGGLALLSPTGEVRSAAGSLLQNLSPQQIRSALPAPGQIFSAPFEAGGSDSAWLLAAARTPTGDTLVGAFSPAGLARQALTGALDPEQTRVMLVAPGEIHLYISGPALSSGHMQGHPGVSESLRGVSGINYYHSADGEHVVAYSPVPPLGWGLVLEESWETIASPLLNTTQSAPLVLAPLLVLALVALGFGARQIVQPLQALQAGASELARGNFAAIEKPVGGISEIRKLQDDLIHTAHELKAAQENQRGYIGAITAGVENERRGLARELHDDTLQTLIALQQRIQLARLAAGEQTDSLQAAQQQVQQTITNLRRLVRGLRPIYLEDLGLSAALEMLARENSQSAGIDIAFSSQGEERRLGADIELALYRMAQEALSNIARHAQARQGWLKLEFLPHAARLTVEDNGRGFQPPAGPSDFARAGHYGLLGLYERAEIIGAALSIDSQPAQGTRVTVTWPAGDHSAVSLDSST